MKRCKSCSLLHNDSATFCVKCGGDLYPILGTLEENLEDKLKNDKCKKGSIRRVCYTCQHYCNDNAVRTCPNCGGYMERIPEIDARRREEKLEKRILKQKQQKEIYWKNMIIKLVLLASMWLLMYYLYTSY